MGVLLVVFIYQCVYIVAIEYVYGDFASVPTGFTLLRREGTRMVLIERLAA